jgi:hypothetical protein
MARRRAATRRTITVHVALRLFMRQFREELVEYIVQVVLSRLVPSWAYGVAVAALDLRFGHDKVGRRDPWR